MASATGRYEGATVKIRNQQGEEVNVRHGHGTYVYPNRCFQYTGEWVCGVKHGRGVFTCGGGDASDGVSSASSSRYEGDFVSGEMTGTGVKQWGDGRTYSGHFLAGHMHGEGRWTGATDSSGANAAESYEGAFQLNQRWGWGTLREPGGREHQGEFRDNKKHGEGNSQWEDGSSHEGEWLHDLRHGFGSELCADGSSFEGLYARDVREGRGRFVHAPSGIQVEGEFRGGKPTVTPLLLRIRVAKPADSSPADGATSDAAGSSARASPSAGATKGLSKKAMEDAKRIADEAAAVRATLTEGVVQLPAAQGGGQLAVLDESPLVTLNPGQKLPVYFLCATTPLGAVCDSESGRTIRVTLRPTPAPQAAPDAAAAAPAAAMTGSASSRARLTAAMALAASLADDEDEPPVLAFCTCPDARTIPWTPLAPLMETSMAAPVPATPTAAASTDEGKKKNRGSLSAAPKSASKRSSMASPALPPLGPPPPFVCTGSCTPAESDRRQWRTSITLTTERGYALMDELWLSGACTPGLNWEMLVEDVTPGIAPASHAAVQAPGEPSRPPAVGAAPTPLLFHQLPSAVAKMLMAGVPPKRATMKLKGKPSAGAKPAAAAKDRVITPKGPAT